MTGAFGTLAFLNPWLLAGLIALPVLWWLLRAIPPSPRLELFAGIRLLLGLEDPERQASKTPWWLLLLRALAIAAVILGFAGPVLNPSERIAEGANGPLLLMMDQGWASAPDWEARVAAASAAIEEAGQAGLEVALVFAASGETTAPIAAGAARAMVEGHAPLPWAPDHAAVLGAFDEGRIAEPGQTIWLTDGLEHGEATAMLAARLAGFGPLRLIRGGQTARALTPPRLVDGKLVTDVIRAGDDGAKTAAETAVVAFAKAETGGERRIAVAPGRFEDGAGATTVAFELPTDLIGSVTRLALAERPSPGGAALADASIQRIRAAIVDPATESAVAALTSASHYLRQALEPWAEVQEGLLIDVLAGDPAAIFLADYGEFTDEERARLTEWVEAGGLLVRFAGPRLAAAVGDAGFGIGGGAAERDPLLPVGLRRGGRVLGGALAWGAPKTLGPFDPSGPFRRLAPPDEVAVRTQVLAEPSPDLDGKVWATLDDGTPLVTAARQGEGRVVLFHVSADAEWSSLPLSGLFVEMLGRLSTLAPGRIAEQPTAAELAGTLWRPEAVIDRDGVPLPASDLAEAVAGEALAGARAGPGIAPGLYTRADGMEREAGAAEAMVVSLFKQGDTLALLPTPPLGTVTERLGGAEALALGPWLIALAIALAAIDILATLWLSGRLTSGRRKLATAALAAFLILPFAGGADAQIRDGDQAVERAADRAAVAATAETTLGYVLTGNGRIDAVSEAAMRGLGNVLSRRTAVEPGPPVGVDPETDELSLFPVLYWPLLGETLPSEHALDRLARYLQLGGMLIIDTQNGATGFGGASGATMRQIARALNLPPLAPVEGDHVLTRAFYLLDRFPGRWRGGRVWVEAPPPGEAERADNPDLPQFDRIDDNVSPVIVGSADWASAWAVDDQGFALFPVGRPNDRQRELALRFGVNVVMYALTGNYKSDQVHAPAVLERLGQ